MNQVAVVQFCSTGDVEANLAKAEKWIESAVLQGASLVVLPENFALFDSSALLSFAQNQQRLDWLFAKLAAWAKRWSVWIVAGTVPMASRLDGDWVSENRVRAASLVFDDRGELVTRYDKIHLFDVAVADKQGQYRESSYIEPGEQLRVIDTPCGKLGLTVCYDLRFAEQYLKLRELGAQLISVPSAFTHKTGEAHWSLLLQARACETQCYLLGSNQGGWHSESRRSWGESLIANPWGVVVAKVEGEQEGVAVACVDLDYLSKVRQQMPLWEHRQSAGSY